MYRIGDFAKLSRVSIKTLRYYDEIGLLKPNQIDRYTRYRYYSMEQIKDLKQIMVLKELGFTLEQIAQLTTEQLSPEQLKGMLLLRKAEIEQQMQSSQQQLVKVNQQLKLIAQESELATVKKEYKTMEPKFIHLEAFKVVGMPYLGKNENQEISQMWDEFIPRIGQIQHVAPGNAAAYGMCFPTKNGLVDYVACLAVTEFKDIPAGMVGRDVPAQTYAVFDCPGLKEIGPTYQYILKDWLPKSGYQPADGPDFELYPEQFNADIEAQHMLYIYFPVVRA